MNTLQKIITTPFAILAFLVLLIPFLLFRAPEQYFVDWLREEVF